MNEEEEEVWGKRLDKIADILEYLSQKSQTSSVLQDASVIEFGLEFILINRMPNLSEKLRKDLFVNGALQNLASKIKLAFALGLIDQKLYNDLTVLKDIRNAFAHPQDPMDFKHPYILKQVRNFKEYTPNKLTYAFYQEKYDSIREQIDKIIKHVHLINELKKSEPKPGKTKTKSEK